MQRGGEVLAAQGVLCLGVTTTSQPQQLHWTSNHWGFTFPPQGWGQHPNVRSA